MSAASRGFSAMAVKTPSSTAANSTADDRYASASCIRRAGLGSDNRKVVLHHSPSVNAFITAHDGTNQRYGMLPQRYKKSSSCEHLTSFVDAWQLLVYSTESPQFLCRRTALKYCSASHSRACVPTSDGSTTRWRQPPGGTSIRCSVH